MLILGIDGSPRRYGATAKLLRLALRAAELNGAHYRILFLYEHDVKPCIGCFSDSPEACREPCPLKDEWSDILELVLESEALIMATPVYWYGPSCMVKIFMERLTILENKSTLGGKNPLEGKAAGVIAAGLEDGSSQAGYYVAQVLNAMGMIIPPYGVVHYTGSGDPLESRTTVLDTVNLGRAVVLASSAELDWYVEPSEMETMLDHARRDSGQDEAWQRPLRESIRSNP